MAQAYVLLNCELGAEEEIIGKLNELENVKEVHGTFGAYDITAKLEAETTESLEKPSHKILGRWTKYVQP